VFVGCLYRALSGASGAKEHQPRRLADRSGASALSRTGFCCVLLSGGTYNRASFLAVGGESGARGYLYFPPSIRPLFQGESLLCSRASGGAECPVAHRRYLFQSDCIK